MTALLSNPWFWVIALLIIIVLWESVKEIPILGDVIKMFVDE